MTDRASRRAREALLDVVGHPLLSSEEDASVIEVSEWIDGYADPSAIDGYADPSAGDFCGVLRALDGEIAVEFYNPYTDVTCYIYSMEGDETFSWCDFRESSLIAGVAYMENIVTMEKGELRLLHRDDPELPLAVREAMEGEPG